MDDEPISVPAPRPAEGRLVMADQIRGPAPSPTSYRVHARTIGDGRAEATAGNEVITFDASWARPASGLPGPAELLASAFAACLLKNLARAGKLLSFQYQDAEVEVNVCRQDAPPKFTEITYELRLTTDEPARRVALVHRNLRQFGTVYNTLAAGCAIEGRIKTRPAGAGR